jgi:DNA-binding NarL/FixJ family response regulator
MTRAVVVADSGPAMAALSLALNELGHVEIVRFASGGSPVTRVVGRAEPDLVLIHELRRPADTLALVTETRSAAPGAAVIVIAADPGARWLAEALLRGAAAVLPAGIAPRTLDLVLQDVLAGAQRAEPATSLAA